MQYKSGKEKASNGGEESPGKESSGQEGCSKEAGKEEVGSSEVLKACGGTLIFNVPPLAMEANHTH